MLLQPITVPFSKSTLKPSVYTLNGDMGWSYCQDRRLYIYALILIKTNGTLITLWDLAGDFCAY